MKWFLRELRFAAIVVGTLVTLGVLLGLAIGAAVNAAHADSGNRDRVIRNILISEGGARYTNNPKDPGGPTKYGITIFDVRKHIKKNATATDVKNLTEAQAINIYRTKYWAHECVRGDDLPKGLDYTIADYAVNSGTGRAGKILRQLMGVPGAGCKITQEMVDRLNGGGNLADLFIAKLTPGDPSEWIVDVADERLTFLKKLRTWRTFGKGWERRVKLVRATSLAMAKETPVMMGGMSIFGGSTSLHEETFPDKIGQSSGKAFDDDTIMELKHDEGVRP